jgi:hypothetical protein
MRLAHVLAATAAAFIAAGCGPSRDCAGGTSQVTVTPSVACELATGNATQCQTVCADGFCHLPSNYVAAYDEAQAEAGVAGTSSGGGGPVCPAYSSDVTITCSYGDCSGRATEGIVHRRVRDGASIGESLAVAAYLEAASVHAFDRLERELAAHHAPAGLRHASRRARRDEVRHTAMMARLARRRGAPVSFPNPPEPLPVRSLFAIARENAIEGCVRETYGATAALVWANCAPDPEVAAVLRSIAADECRHAELAWDVAAWAAPRLSPDERRAIDLAMREAIQTLAEKDAPLVALLEDRVWRAGRAPSRAFLAQGSGA